MKKWLASFISDGPRLRFYLVPSVLYIFYVAHAPVQIYASSPHDDAMFWTHAYSIVSGQWLGQFSQMTLPKGVGYPLFLAFVSVTGVSVSVLLAIVQLLAAFSMSKALIAWGLNHWLSWIAFIFANAQSALITVRPTRDYFYASLVILFISGLMLILKEKPLRYHTAIFFGLAAGFLFITREEGAWVAPAILLLLVAAFLKFRNFKAYLLRRWRIFLVYLSSTLIVIFGVSAINFASYGTFTTQDFTVGSYPRVFETLQSVQFEKEIRHVAVPEKTRDELYKLSPAFGELQEYFEGPGMGWTEHSCNFSSEKCGEYGTGWFLWALRDAVASRGYYENPALADAYYSRLQTELNELCSSKKLNCVSKNFGLIPKLSNQDIIDFPNVLNEAIGLLIYKDYGVYSSGYSVGDAQVLYLIKSFLGSPRTAPTELESRNLASGWIYPGKPELVQIACEGVPLNSNLTKLKSPDLVLAFKDPEATDQRFKFSFNSNDVCTLQLEKSPETRIELKDLKNGPNQLGNSKVFIDYLVLDSTSRAFEVFNLTKTTITDWLEIVNPVMLFGGSALWVLLLLIAIFKRDRSPSVWYVGALWFVTLGRVILIAYVATTSFPAVFETYILPAYFALPFAAVATLGLAFDTFSRMKRAAS